ncbi:hypothetical protein SDC9_139728 [bioreactor metagenome]|uniref:Uncharacterized protein n=1 Tax=bioreactor metagenome TaxID=1076179 RepID=A0A645DVG6_9ZZZZ
MVSHKCVCIITPLLRAKSFVSFISLVLTEKGEQGANAILVIAKSLEL